MRVITEAKLQEREQQLRAELKALRRRARGIHNELRIVEALAAELVEIPPPQVAVMEPAARPVNSSANGHAPAAAETPHPLSGRAPTGPAHMNRVQGPIFDLVKRSPGILRADAQRMVSEKVGNTIASSRETVRRMLVSGKLRQEEGRLYVNDERAGDEESPALWPATNGTQPEDTD